jgi:N-acetylglucosamine-6-phosphate deacetylase
MELVVHRAIAQIGLPVSDVATAAATTPARRLALAGETGALTPGLSADLALLTADYCLQAVMSRGDWVPRPPVPGRPVARPRRS